MLHTRGMTRSIKSIIIHCAATPNGKWFQAGDIDAWHKARGFKRTEAFRTRQNGNLVAIGYHFVILTNGAIATGRHWDEIGAHAQGYNSKSLGVCLIGTDKFSLRQWQSLKGNINSLREQIMHLQGDAEPPRVFGHRDLPGVAKDCPGFSVQDWLANDMQPLPDHVLHDPSGA